MKDFEFRGRTFHLYLNGLALFACYKRYGHEKDLFELIEPDTKDGYEATIWMLCEFSRQGELYRRFLGEDAGKALDYQETLVAATPAEYPGIKAAVMATIMEGFGREHLSEEDEDPWLAEFEAQKQKKKDLPKRNIFERFATWVSAQKME